MGDTQVFQEPLIESYHTVADSQRRCGPNVLESGMGGGELTDEKGPDSVRADKVSS